MQSDPWCCDSSGENGARGGRAGFVINKSSVHKRKLLNVSSAIAHEFIALLPLAVTLHVKREASNLSFISRRNVKSLQVIHHSHGRTRVWPTHGAGI